MTTNPAIVFIGFMGAGKSWAAAAVDGLAGPAQDIDDLIEAATGMSVRDFFDSEGEESFREVEKDAAVRLLREADGGVIALGGGTVLSPDVRSELKRHIVVWLNVAADTAWDRVSETDRPLVARGRAKFDALLAKRKPIYAELADVVLPEGDPDLILRALPSIQALAELPSGTKLLWAASASGEYPVFVGGGLLGSGWWPRGGRRFCVTDAAVGPLYADRLEPLAARVEVEPGEATKTLAAAERVLSALAQAGMTREDHVAALGGGVVGDLAGFCAHTYQRGVPVVQVPTTLVAQVDSAYGGKTGVDLPEGKNYVGAYHLPAAVLADTATLASLPEEELAAGFVEVLKTGLLAGGSLWERVRALEALDPRGLDDVVFACARYKCEVVAADERDAGVRQVLNLGHTVGHAIEAATGYERYRHGEAVGLGLLAALRLSDAAELREQVRQMLDSHGLPTELDAAIELAAILDALQRDKKRTAAGVGFVLLAEPGEPRTGQLVDAAKVEAAVKELHE
jgi:shikimate kinase/3-dehydroquinate synthase